MRQFLKTIPPVRYLYGRHLLRRYRQAAGPALARLTGAAPPGIGPLTLAHSLQEFDALVRHPRFPADLFEGLLPPGPGPALERAFANFAGGCAAEERLGREWQHAATLSEAAERRLTEYLNRYLTYALRTLAGHLEAQENPENTDAIRLGRVLSELEDEEGELLDVGCAFVPLAGRYARIRRWVGLDLSLPALAIARFFHAPPPGVLVCAYGENLPFADQSFDVVVSLEVLEHTPRPRRMIAEIARVLRGGGKAVVSVPMHIVDFQDGRQHLIGPTDSTHRFSFHSLEELQRLFREHGLTVERLQSDPHYVFTLRRSGVQAFGRSGAEDPPDPRGPSNPSDPTGQTPERLNAQTPERLNTGFACADCRAALQAVDAALHCPACDTRYPRRDGVPVLLPRQLRSARLDLVR